MSKSPTIVGTREQLAALLVDGADSAPGPQLTIHGNPGDWSVAVTNAYDGIDAAWLGSARAPTVMRTFKTLDAAFSSALEIARMAAPADEQRWTYTNVRIVTVTKKEAA